MTWEKWLQGIFGVIFAGLMVWVGTTVSGNREKLAVAQTQLQTLSSQVSRMQEILDNRSIPIGQITEIQNRINDHETRLRALERP